MSLGDALVTIVLVAFLLASGGCSYRCGCDKCDCYKDGSCICKERCKCKCGCAKNKTCTCY